MRKTIWSLAALMLFMVATVMTSCSKEDDVVTPKENVVTLTVQMPEEAQSRVSVIDDGTINLIDWELDDPVKVYNVQFNNDTGRIEVTGGHVFRCTDLATYTFTGILPEGKTLQDYNVAVYGHDIEPVMDYMYVGFHDKKVSTNLKDVIFLAGEITADSCILDIRNNVVKVINDKEPVEVAWGWLDFFVKPYCLLDDENHFTPAADFDDKVDFSDVKFTIPTGISYVFMPPTVSQELGLYDSNREPVVRKETFSGMPHFTVGKIFDPSSGDHGSDNPGSGDPGPIVAGSVGFKASDFSVTDGANNIRAEKEGINIVISRTVGTFSSGPNGTIICNNPDPDETMGVLVSSSVGNIVRVSCSANGSIPLEGDGSTCSWILKGSDEGWKSINGDKFMDLYLFPSQTITVEYK